MQWTGGARDRDLPIPEGPEQLTDAWLTLALRGVVLREAAVVAHATELAEVQGAAGVVARVHLRYDVAEPEAPASVVAKFASPHAPIRTLMHAFGGYRSEVEFYRQFGADPGIPTPRCYHADIEPASGAFVLLLEDMSDCRVSYGVAPVEDAEVAIRHLAPFHAKWWNHSRIHDAEFLRPPGSAADRLFSERGRAALSAALPATVERFGKDFPPVLTAVGERVLSNFDSLADAQGELFDDSGTLVHGDYHPQQIFFPTERGGRFAVFDWQMVHAGNGGDDLARIIGTGLTGEQQAASAEKLISLYHSLLVEHGVTGFSEEQSRDRFSWAC